MGKLHKIRKAIEKHPDHWINGWQPGNLHARSADILANGTFIPAIMSGSYQKYVRKVLRSLGHDVK